MEQKAWAPSVTRCSPPTTSPPSPPTSRSSTR